MREAAQEALSIVLQTDHHAFLQSPILLRATERCVEIVGEAAGHVSQQGRSACPNIPWRQIIGQRNVLAHEYGQIDHNILYHTATEDIPNLIEQLDQAINTAQNHR